MYKIALYIGAALLVLKQSLAPGIDVALIFMPLIAVALLHLAWICLASSLTALLAVIGLPSYIRMRVSEKRRAADPPGA